MLREKGSSGPRVQRLHERDPRGDQIQAIEDGEVGVGSTREAELSNSLFKFSIASLRRNVHGEGASRRQIPPSGFPREFHLLQQRTSEVGVDQFREELLVS